jgi:hypothetical protein
VEQSQSGDDSRRRLCRGCDDIDTSFFLVREYVAPNIMAETYRKNARIMNINIDVAHHIRKCRQNCRIVVGSDDDETLLHKDFSATLTF